jgi:DNA invertase Pin-like site-specific DNA recombinase
MMRKAKRDRLPGVPPTPEDLAAQAAAVAAVRVARIERDRVTKRDIATAAELSRQWVHRIVRDR